MKSKDYTPKVKRFEGDGDLRIYQLCLLAFPEFYVHAHLILGLDTPTSIDVGSRWSTSNKDLVTAFEEIKSAHGEKVLLSGVGRIIITYGYLDHFGDLGFMRERTCAPIGVHSLDSCVITNF